MITAVFVGDGAVTARLAALAGRINEGLARAVTRLGFELQRKVQDEKLAGGVLAVQSGALRASIRARIEERHASISAAIGTANRYAAFHEFGFHGQQNVRAHLRTIKQAFGRNLRAGAREIAIGAHARRLDLPARSFLSAALSDMTPRIREELTLALTEALGQ